jgi:hypothetical protein
MRSFRISRRKLDTLISRFAASIRVHLAVASSKVIVTFLIDTILV